MTPEVKLECIRLLSLMRKESENMVEDFESIEKDSYYNALSSIASKQAAMCTILIELIRKN